MLVPFVLLFESLRDRYLMLLNDPYLEYISIFQNFGPKAGASIYHPHYQILSIPVVPPDVSHSVPPHTSIIKKTQDNNHRKNDDEEGNNGAGEDWGLLAAIS